ncbi:unnamed protein product [Diamesa serratosioi]
MNLLTSFVFGILTVVVQAELWVGRDIQKSVNKFNENGFIIGGNEAQRNQFPYQAGILMTIPGNVNTATCGGSVISSNRVLTAAHCLDTASSAEVVLGAHMLRGVEPTQIRINVPASGLVIHPGYIARIVLNDVAIINLPTEVTFNSFIQPIALADGTNDFAGENAVVSGWGIFDSTSVASPVLRFVNLQVITNLSCRIRFPTITNGTICASGDGNVGGCSGDSGGPLAIQSNEKSILVGVAVFVSGVLCDSGLPTGFSRVTSFIPWIKENML